MRGMRKRLLLVFVCLLALPASAARRHSADTIVVGGLFSLTGDGGTLGKASQAALELAARDLNEEFEELVLPYRVKVVVFDTKLTPAGAVEGIQALHDEGATIVIGPQSSAEAAAIRDFATERRMVVISQGSTASSLAIAGDTLYRLAPNDRIEGEAVAALIEADGVEVLVPVWRADAGNTGLKTGVTAFYDGIEVDGVSYDPATTDFTATVNALGAAVRAAKNAHPGRKVAVYLAAFEEGAAILDRARLDADLLVNWYGGDGLTQSRALLANGAVASFAAATKFTAPAVTLSEQTRDRWQPLSEEIETRVGFLPDAFSLSVYDAAMVSVLAAAEARRPFFYAPSFERNVQRYWGVTGPLALDAAGDRRLADFDFWTVKETGTSIDWMRTASFAGGRLVR